MRHYLIFPSTDSGRGWVLAEVIDDSAIEAAVDLTQQDRVQIHLGDPEWGDAH
jgi:hypothetical protein